MLTALLRNWKIRETAGKRKKDFLTIFFIQAAQHVSHFV